MEAGNQPRLRLPASQAGHGEGGHHYLSIKRHGDLQSWALGDDWVSQVAQGKKGEKIADTQSAPRRVHCTALGGSF